jgi:hypothetical protein
VGVGGAHSPATIFRLLPSSATYIVPCSMTGPLSHVALFRPRNNPRHFVIDQAGPSRLSKRVAEWRYRLMARGNPGKGDFNVHSTDACPRVPAEIPVGTPLKRGARA